MFLNGVRRAASLVLMRPLLRRLGIVAITLAFLGGTIGVAFAFGAEPCDAAFHAAPQGHEGHHHHHDTNVQPCLTCLCCAVVPTLPGAPITLSAPQQVAYVFYQRYLHVMTGRSVAPDLAPPKSIA